MLEFITKIFTQAILKKTTGENPNLICYKVLGAVVRMVVLCIGSFFLAVFLLFDLLSELSTYIGLFLHKHYLNQYDSTALAIIIRLCFIIILFLIIPLLVARIKALYKTSVENNDSAYTRLYRIINAFLDGFSSK